MSFPLQEPIPLHRVATALPFIDYLHRKGAPVERELLRARLPVIAMNDPDCFIPSQHYWEFITNIAACTGIRDLGFQVGRQSGANAADPSLAKRLRRLPSLHQALEQFCITVNTEISHVSLWLEPAGSVSHNLYYRTSYDCEHPAYVHFQWYGLIATLNAIRLFTGRQWQPGQIGLATNKAPGKAIRTYLSNTRFHTGQTDCYITLSNRLLGNPPGAEKDSGQTAIRRSKIKLPKDFIGTLKLALRSYLRDGAPSLELAADIAGLSTRTLQRHLAEDDLNYRELLTELRYETTIDYMQNTDNTITDIANLLGYSDPTHFARAFRRMAGVSPREYQRQLHE